MFRSQRFKPLLYLKGLTTPPSLQTPKPNSPFPSTLFPKHISLTSQQHSFAASYLVNTFGLSPETALKVSERVRFDTPQKPDSVIAFFTSNGFTVPQIKSIVKRVPDVLNCNPHKRLWPKFQFLLSKGASYPSDIVHLVNRCPRIINSSLEKNVIPTFELDSSITYLFRRRASILLSKDLRKNIDEVKELGFDPSKMSFVMALHAKMSVPKSRWDAKVDACKSWGWSEEMVLDAFRKHPIFMLGSKDKINEVMRFWVDQLGWDPLALAKMPKIFGYSLKGRIIPRGLVVRYLIGKGLRKKSASLLTPFSASERLFLENYVMRFKEETHQLSKVYVEK